MAFDAWRMLLRAYPPEFRDEYGTEILGALRERAGEQKGFARVRFYLAAGTDVIVTAFGERRDGMIRDLKFSYRRLRATPGVTAIAILSLALGIGANTTMFSVVYATLLRPLPYPDSDRRVVVRTTMLNRPSRTNFGGVAPGDYVDWRKACSTLKDWHLFGNLHTVVVTGQDKPERVQALAVTAGFLESMGVIPVAGRFFQSEDMDDRAILISAEYWNRGFGGSHDVIGKTLIVGGEPATIIGIVPTGFEILNYAARADIWQVISLEPGSPWVQRVIPFLDSIAVLKPGVSVEQADAEMSAIAARLAEAYPETNKNRGVLVMPMQEARSGNLGALLYPLFGAVGFILLIACTNVANLLLARAASRRREISVRTALGASRGRIAREFLADGVALAAPGVVFGIALAYGGIVAFKATLPFGLAGLAEMKLSWPVLLFTASAGVLAAILSAIFPAIQSSRVDVNETLKDGGRGTIGRGGMRLRSALVAAEIALAMILLAGAGLTLASLRRLESHTLGFNPRDVTVAPFTLTTRPYMTNGAVKDIDMRYVEPRMQLFLEHMLREISALPGVERAAFAGGVPMGPMDAGAVTVRFPGKTEDPAAAPRVMLNIGTPGFFETLRIPMRRGRSLTDLDTKSAPWVAIVNETFAREFFPESDPIGQVVHLGAGPEEQPREIVGVVADYTQFTPRFPIQPMVYASHFQQGREIPGNLQGQRLRPVLVIRSAVPVTPEAIAKAAAAFDKDLAMFDVRSLEWHIRQRGSDVRFNAGMLSVFSGIAVLLAVVGIYGLMSYFVEGRRHEIGIRMSLGASRREIIWLIVSYGLKLAAIGLAVGLAGALGVTQFLRAFLYQVQPGDPPTFIAVTVLLLAVVIAATMLPALRASSTDAAVALRSE